MYLEIENESLIIQTEYIRWNIKFIKCNKNIILAGQNDLVEKKTLELNLCEEFYDLIK